MSSFFINSPRFFSTVPGFMPRSYATCSTDLPDRTSSIKRCSSALKPATGGDGSQPMGDLASGPTNPPGESDADNALPDQRKRIRAARSGKASFPRISFVSLPTAFPPPERPSSLLIVLLPSPRPANTAIRSCVGCNAYMRGSSVFAS